MWGNVGGRELIAFSVSRSFRATQYAPVVPGNMTRVQLGPPRITHVARAGRACVVWKQSARLFGRAEGSDEGAAFVRRVSSGPGLTVLDTCSRDLIRAP
ncbi:hypothetical protein BHE74_00012135 [Ensete ventricosum]|nr:hypothetical protein GW17_00002362 [Ensete ventricosum]RWW79561.1 hypothetical protein BHE74_00012135 [Ensete ventricosum]RZR86312.1 hypothetical protein BHM03_00013492 [Ensete ventricosum]